MKPLSERTSLRSTRSRAPKVKLKGVKAKAEEAIRKFAEGSAWVPAVEWIEANVYDWTTVKEYNGVFDFTDAKLIQLTEWQKEMLNIILTPHACETTGTHLEGCDHCGNCITGRTGQFPYSMVIWSQPKKHGKTQIAAAVAAWWACKVEAPNLIYSIASNQEQSAGLIFSSAKPTMFAQGGKVPTSTNATPEIRLPNGTLFKAIPNNYAGQAGGNYGATFWSELWTHKSERDLRLWEELPPVPTRKNSIRWAETYAGFETESLTLMDQFKRFFKDTQESAMVTEPTEAHPHVPSPVPGLEHLMTGRGSKARPACWHIAEERIFMFWDHEIRAPWVSQQYMTDQKASNRHATYVRLWENRWQASQGTFIEPELYDDAVTVDQEEWGPMVLAGDASQRNDTTALVGVQKRKVKIFGVEQERYRLMLVRVWDPHGQDIDLDMTIAKYVKRLYDAGCMAGPFRYDPFQMHQVAVNLRKIGVRCKEFNQGQERLKADTYLWKQFHDRTIDLYPSDIMEAHVKAANAKEYENSLVRIIKGEASEARKVDAAVALSMAVWAASGRIAKDKNKKRPQTISYSMFD